MRHRQQKDPGIEPQPAALEQALLPTLPAPAQPGARELATPAPTDEIDTTALPEHFDEYYLVRHIGAGAMGQVYLAHDTELDRMVAIKLVSTPSPASHERVRAEARAAAAIQHPNVVTIHRVGMLDDQPYIVTEYIRGTSLDAVARPMPWQRALAIGIDLARGLAAAHRHGVLHRDIKPANAILAESGLAKLIDFGLAVQIGAPGQEATAGDAPVGTPPYMAPELWDGEPASQCTDVYAMGVLLYELCTGRMPGSDAGERPRLEDLVPGLDPRLAMLVHRCLAHAPAARYASGDALRDALEALQAPLHAAATAHALPAGNPYRGLLPFETAHRALFFGRGAEVRLILDRLRTQRFVLLAGESGVGKSSLAQAGVLPLVVEGALGDERTWTTWRHVPGPRPLTILAHTLAAYLGVNEDALVRDIECGDVAAVSRRLRGHQGDSAGLVLLFDQLEELVTIADRDEAARASTLLASLAARAPGVRILATARADYLAPLAALPGLGPLVERSLCIIRPLGAEAMREVVVAPARATGVRFESGDLVQRMVTSATHADGALPLLQFALAQLWEQRDVQAGVITAAAFEAIGGVEGALARHATGVLQALLPDTRRAVRHILVRLVTGSGVRSRLTASELGIGEDDARRKAIDALVAGRLVVADDLEGEPVYEIAHEALISGWPKLRAWLSRESNTRIVRERLAAAAREWEGAGRAREYLWGPRQLAAAETIDPADLTAFEQTFQDASARAIRRGRWERRLTAMAVLALLAGAYGVYRFNVEQEIDIHVAAAEQAMGEARSRSRVFDAQREQTMRELGADRHAEAEARWKRVLALVPEVDAAYRHASLPLELALSLDPRRRSTRALMGALLDERARLAESMGREREREQVVERLALYDHAAAARWSAPIPVAIHTRPPAAITIERYVSQANGALLPAAWADGRAHATPLQTELPPGSYVLVMPADATHVEVRYPFVVHPDAPAIDLDIARPPRAAVPAGFIAIPPGRFLSGFGQSGDDEPLRRFYEARPLHERTTGAFLIARHESTYEDWMAFLDACWPAGCDGVVPSLPAVESDATSTVAMALRPHAEHGWEFLLWPTEGRIYRAVRGQPLVYEGRSTRQVQRWERMPVSGVSWGDVQAYLRWLRASGRVPGARLCTAEEWERAARGADARVFPHGNSLQPDDANFDQTYGQVAHAFGPDEVGAHPRSASPFGLHDMAGNLWELVATDAGATGPGQAQEGAPVRPVQVRGGCYFQQVEVNAVVNAWVMMSDQRASTVGFRVCADAP